MLYVFIFKGWDNICIIFLNSVNMYYVIFVINNDNIRIV